MDNVTKPGGEKVGLKDGARVATVDQFARIESVRIGPLFAALHALAVDDASGGAGLSFRFAVAGVQPNARHVDLGLPDQRKRQEASTVIVFAHSSE